MDSKSKYKPKGFSKSDDQEAAGNLLLQNLVRNEPLVKLILAGNDKTPNRDGFIELRDTNNIVGKLEVQVKPVNSQRKKMPAYNLPRHLVGYSQVAGLPFILICYDRSAEKAYWKKIDESLFKDISDTQERVTVFFEEEERIGPGFPYLRRWQEISKEHLEICEMGTQYRTAFSILQQSNPSETLGLSTAPQDLVALIKQLLHTTADKFRTRLQDAKNLLEANEPVAATQLVEQLKKEILSGECSPDVILNLHLCLGSCYTRLEQERKAESCFREALKIDPNSAKAQANLAHVLFICNSDNEEALEFARRAYAADPSNDFAVAIYILCLGKCGKVEAIQSLMSEHGNFFHDSRLIQLALAQDLKGRGELEAALPFFERCVAIEPENVHARILRAETVYLMEQDEIFVSKKIDQLGSNERNLQPLDFVEQEALIAIQALASTSDRHGLMRAFELCALVNMDKKNYFEAISYCDKTIAIMPQHIQTYEIKGRCLFELSECEKALETLHPMLKHLSRAGKQTLAYSSFRLKKYSIAADYFNSYIQLTDTDREWFLYTNSLWLSDNREVATRKVKELRDAGRLTVKLERDLTVLGCVTGE